MPVKRCDFATLSDPRFVAALVVLIVNDWWLKAEFGNWLTGKLSDVAGLVVLPVVVAGVLGALRVPRASAVACASVGTWFAAIKTLEPVAHATERLAGAITGTQSAIVVDPTDLIGLGGLFVAAAVVERPRPLLGNRVARGVLFAVAMLACTATSNDGGTVTDLGVTADGEVVAGGRSNYYLDELAEAEAGADSDGAEADRPAGMGQRETEACLDGSGETACFRIIEGRVERRSPGGEWQLEWALFDMAIISNHVGAGLGYTPSLHATDIVAAPDGSVHVAFDGIDPITRSPAGDWQPPVATHRPIVHMVALIVVAFGAAVLAAATKGPAARIVVAALAVGATLALFVSLASTGLVGPAVGSILAFGLTTAGLVYAVAAGRDELNEPSQVKRSFAVGIAGITAAIGCLLVWKYVVAAPAMLWSLAPAVAFAGVLGANAVTALGQR